MARRLLPGFLVFAALLSDVSGNHGVALVLVSSRFPPRARSRSTVTGTRSRRAVAGSGPSRRRFAVFLLVLSAALRSPAVDRRRAAARRVGARADAGAVRRDLRRRADAASGRVSDRPHAMTASRPAPPRPVTINIGMLARLAHVVHRRRKRFIAVWVVLTLFGLFATSEGLGSLVRVVLDPRLLRVRDEPEGR